MGTPEGGVPTGTGGTAPRRSRQTWYRDVAFRSNLEARWAATFDMLDIHWVYEPHSFPMPRGAVYVPDFYLPTLRTYCEVKQGRQRLWKPQKLSAQLAASEFLPEEYQVVILRPGEDCTWEHVDPSRPAPLLAGCAHCQGYGFASTDLERGEWCRRCWTALGTYTERYFSAAVRGFGSYLPLARPGR